MTVADGTNRHAVVLGGGIAGLLAARALTNHFDRVTIIEKGDLARDLAPRKTAPQGAHVHGLLSRGREIMEHLFPGVTAELVAGGATLAGINDVRIYILGWRKTHDGDDKILAMTRPFLELILANRVRALNSVTIQENAEAIGLAGTTARVTGVVVRDGEREREVQVGFIVDARGRSSNLADWMKRLGLEPPQHETSPLSSVYCSYLLEPEPGAERPLLHQVARIDEKIGVLLFPVEQGRVQLSIGANAHIAMPKSHEEALAFMLNKLPVPDAYEAAKRLRPVTAPAYSRFTASVRRKYDALKQLPEGIVAIGDAVASFNPIFGQGMTIAALEAEWLDQCLAKNDPAKPGFAKAYYAGVKPIVDLAWGWPDLESKRDNPRAQNWPTRFLLWYTERMQYAATRNAYVSKTIMRVQNMIDPPAAVFKPSMFFRVIFT